MLESNLNNKLTRGATANTPDFGSGNPRSNRGGSTKCLCGEMVNAVDSKSTTHQTVCRFDSGQRHNRPGGFPETKTVNVMDNEKFIKFYKSGPHFRIENPNPDWAEKRGFKWDRGDCVIRALANAISCSWLAAFDYLTAKARRDFNVPNDGPGFRRWLVEDGATWTHCKAEKGKKRMTVLEFAESHPIGRYVVCVASHETACVDGVILDAWNCGGDCVVGYLDMSNFRLD